MQPRSPLSRSSVPKNKWNSDECKLTCRTLIAKQLVKYIDTVSGNRDGVLQMHEVETFLDTVGIKP